VTLAEKLKIVRRSYAAFCALDIDALVELYTPDCEWELGEWGAALGARSLHGHEGLRAWFSDILDLIDELTVCVLEVRALGDCLLVHGDGSAKFKSGIEASMAPYWQKIEFADGRCARVTQLEAEPVGWVDAAPTS
jgi:ketosteroid isomerase-like protein